MYQIYNRTPPDTIQPVGAMETPEPGPADGEERVVELRPRTRSNPEGAEDRRSSNGSLGGVSAISAVSGVGGSGVGSASQPSVGSRVDGEGEASTSSSPPSVTTATPTMATASPAAAAAASATTAVVAAAAVGMAASTPGVAKERPKPTQPALAATQINASGDTSLRAPRVNCPEKVV